MKVAVIQIHGSGISEFKKKKISGHIIFCDLFSPQSFTHSTADASNNNDL